MKKLLIVLLLLVSAASYATVSYGRFQTEVFVTSAYHKDAFRNVVDRLCKNDDDEKSFVATQVYKNLEQKMSSGNSSIKSFSNCLLAAGISRIIWSNKLHYGFSLNLTNSTLSNITQTISSNNLNYFSKSVKKLFNRHKDYNDHFVFRIRETQNALHIRSLTGLSLERINEGEALETVNISGLSYGTDTLSKGYVKNVLDFNSIFYNTFIEFWKQGKKQASIQEFKNKFNLHALEKVKIKVARTRNEENPKATDNDQSPVFDFNKLEIFDEDATKIAYGYSQNVGKREYKRSRMNKQTEWVTYTVGLVNETYNSLRSAFSELDSIGLTEGFTSLNQQPLSEIRPELAGGMSAINLGYNLVVLRHKSIEYITLDGRPCNIDSGNRDIFHCELPITKDFKFTFEGMEAYLEYVKEHFK